MKHQIVAATLLAGFLAFYVPYSLARPALNWDMLLYVALALQPAARDPAVLHAETFQEVKTNVPEKRYRELTEGPAYRETMARRPELFCQQLDFCRIKPLYVWLVRGLMRSGFSGPRATVIPSLVSVLLIGGLLFAWLSAYLTPGGSLGLTVMVLFAPPMMELSRLSTPDGVSTLLVLLAFYMLLEWNRTVPFLALLAVSLLVRPDNVILGVGAVVALAWTGRLKWSHALAGAAALAACYLGLSWWLDSRSWEVLFYHTFVERLAAPETTEVNLSLSQYVAALKWGVGTLPHYSLLLALVFPLSVILLRWPRTRRLHWLDGLLAALLGVVFVRYLLYPDVADRLLMPLHVLFVIVPIKLLATEGLAPRQVEYGT